MVDLVIDSPQKRQIGKSILVPMSGKYSMRIALQEALPTAVIVSNIIKPPPSQIRNSHLAKLAQSVISNALGRNRIQIDNKYSSHVFVAFTGITQAVYMHQSLGLQAVSLSPEPKLQADARKRADADDWITAELIEMDTVYNMGIIEFVLINKLARGVNSRTSESLTSMERRYRRKLKCVSEATYRRNVSSLKPMLPHLA